MMTARAKLDALLSVLHSAAHEAITEYERTGEVPSTESAHPLDFQPPSFALMNALRILEGACEQLCTTLAPPAHTLLNRRMVPYEPACIRLVVEAKVANILVDHPEGLSVSEIAKETIIEQGKLSRILRFLATKNCFREVSKDIFTNNRLSLHLVSSSPLSDVMMLSTPTSFGQSKLYACLIDPEYGPSISPDKSPFMFNVKDQGHKDFFDFMKHHPREEQIFASAMNGLSKVLRDDVVLIERFPWKELLPGSTVCDVGCGIGHISLALAKTNPHLQLTLQDQPQVLELARDMWNHECLTAVEKRRVEFVPFDFFKEGPVKDQDIYYIRHVVHNWSDSVATNILKKVRDSMKPSSRLLIHEYILLGLHQQHLSDPTDRMNRIIAPEPLLPNFGAGNIRPYYQDMNMMMLLNGRERSLDDFKALGVEAGLRFVKVWDFAQNMMVEFKVAP